MDEVTVKRLDLLALVKDNAKLHRDVFEEAFKGYTLRVEDELRRKLRDLKAGYPIDTAIRLTAPVDHTKDYERVIKMLEMEVEPIVTIDAHEFGRYAMDDWEWMPAFTESANFYAGASDTVRMSKFGRAARPR